MKEKTVAGRTKKAKTTAVACTAVESTSADLYQLICTEAYFRAERRGFAAGSEWQDWFEAEQAVRNQLGMEQRLSS